MTLFCLLTGAFAWPQLASALRRLPQPGCPFQELIRPEVAEELGEFDDADSLAAWLQWPQVMAVSSCVFSKSTRTRQNLVEQCRCSIGNVYSTPNRNAHLILKRGLHC